MRGSHEDTPPVCAETAGNVPFGMLCHLECTVASGHGQFYSTPIPAFTATPRDPVVSGLLPPRRPGLRPGPGRGTARAVPFTTTVSVPRSVPCIPVRPGNRFVAGTCPLVLGPARTADQPGTGACPASSARITPEPASRQRHPTYGQTFRAVFAGGNSAGKDTRAGRVSKVTDEHGITVSSFSTRCAHEL